MSSAPPTIFLPCRRAALGLLLFAGACSEPESRSNPVRVDKAAHRGVVPAEARQQTGGAKTQPPYDPGGSVEPSPKYQNADVPEAGSKCEFEERDPAERPKNFIPASHSSNIIFYQRPNGGPLWGDIDPDGATAELEEKELIVAARFRKPDLWIRPKEGRATLQVGKRLTCY